jgi:hypothetical protein
MMPPERSMDGVTIAIVRAGWRADRVFEPVDCLHAQRAYRSLHPNGPVTGVCRGHLACSDVTSPPAGRMFRNMSALRERQPAVIAIGSWLTVKEQGH